MNNIKEIIIQSWNEYSENFKKLAIIALGIELIPMLIGLVSYEAALAFFSTEVYEAVVIVAYIFWNVSYLVFLFYLLSSISKLKVGEVSSLAEDFFVMKAKFLGLIGVFVIWLIILTLAVIPTFIALYFIYDDLSSISALVVLVLSAPSFYVFYRTMFIYLTYLVDDESPINALTASVEATKNSSISFKGYIIIMLIWILYEVLLNMVASFEIIPVYVQWVLDYCIWISVSIFGLIFLKNLYLASIKVSENFSNTIDSEI